MYTAHGSLAEISAFLEGYFSGLAKGGSDAAEFANKFWFEFLDSLHEETEECKSRAWQDVVTAFEESCDSNKQAITEVLQRYRDYIRTHGLIRPELPD
jgi:hypothetical protein